MSHEGDLHFFLLENVTEDVAPILARYDDDLLLGLAEISPAIARALARHRHSLFLNDITEISPATARALAGHGRARFDKSLAAARANHERWLTAIRTLQTCLGHPHMAALADAVQFGSLEGHEWSMLGLDGLRTLRLDVAQELGQHRGVLMLSGLETISDDVAAALASHRGVLVLSGLQSLSRPAAAALASSSRWKPDWIRACSGLHLDGVKELSVEVATELATFDGLLSLSGISELSPAVASALAAHKPTNVVWRTLTLDGLERLSVATAERLAEHAEDLVLNGLTEISPELAEPLSRHRGRLFLGGVRQLTTMTAALLLGSPNVHLVAGPPCLEPRRTG